MAPILLIEPDLDAREDLRRTLEGNGWQVFAFADSQAALSNAGDAWLAVAGPSLDATARACIEAQRAGEGRILLIDAVPAETISQRVERATRLALGAVSIDLLSGEGRSGSERVAFTALEAALLAFFYQHHGVPL